MQERDNEYKDNDFYKREKSIYTLCTLFILICIISFGGIIIYKGAGSDSAKWREIGKNIYRSQNVIVPPIRGTIYSSNGMPISITAPYYMLRFDFNHNAIRSIYKSPIDSAGRVLRDSLNMELYKLADLLYKKYKPEYSRLNKTTLMNRWRRGLAKRSRNTPVLPFKISYLDYKELMQQEPLCLQPNKKGRRIKRSLMSKMIAKGNEFSRIKPFGSLASRTIGNITRSTINGGVTQGRMGLELGYDSILTGHSGKAIRRYIAGKYSQTIVDPVDNGASLYTSLDMEKQAILESAMKQEMSKIDAESGSAILMEVNTGRILAISNLKQSDDGKYYEDVNYAVSDMTEPGSTFKVASMLVALDEDKVSPNDTIDTGNGMWGVAGSYVKDYNYHRGGFGKITAAEAIQHSSNVALAKIITKAYGDNPDHYVDRIRGLGFGLDLGLKIPGYAKAYIRKRSDNERLWYGTTLAWMSYGYEIQVPPIYTLAFYNAIANNGKYMKPYLVDSIVKDGKTIEVNNPEVMIQKIAKDKSLSEIKQMLREVVLYGTGKKLQNHLVDISGKSGTAQIARGGSYRGKDGTMYLVSFCAYFPSEAPEYSCIVVIRNPRIGHAGGGSMAGPVVRDVAMAIYSRRLKTPIDSISNRIKPDNSVSSIYGLGNKVLPLIKELGVSSLADSSVYNQGVNLKLSADGKASNITKYKYRKGVVPNVVGMTASDATLVLARCGYKPVLVGSGWVVSQSTPAGVNLAQGKTIKIVLK